MEKFLRTRKLEGRATCYKTSKEEILSHAFKHLNQNPKLYNGVKI